MFVQNLSNGLIKPNKCIFISMLSLNDLYASNYFSKSDEENTFYIHV